MMMHMELRIDNKTRRRGEAIAVTCFKANHSIDTPRRVFHYIDEGWLKRNARHEVKAKEEIEIRIVEKSA